jgi:hypothetical protein
VGAVEAGRLRIRRQATVGSVPHGLITLVLHLGEAGLFQAWPWGPGRQLHRLGGEDGDSCEGGAAVPYDQDDLLVAPSQTPPPQPISLHLSFGDGALRNLWDDDGPLTLLLAALAVDVAFKPSTLSPE